MVEGEKANGFQLRAKALGNPENYAWIAFAENLNPDIGIQILHSGEGTLWTDLKNASLGTIGGAKILSSPELK
ncbi:MAG: hypothetical protein QXH80_04795 [Candidatus Nanoarchaeia archaeon]